MLQVFQWSQELFAKTKYTKPPFIDESKNFYEDKTTYGLEMLDFIQETKPICARNKWRINQLYGGKEDDSNESFVTRKGIAQGNIFESRDKFRL